MIEVLEFIFQDFLHFIGTIAILLTIMPWSWIGPFMSERTIRHVNTTITRDMNKPAYEDDLRKRMEDDGK